MSIKAITHMMRRARWLHQYPRFQKLGKGRGDYYQDYLQKQRERTLTKLKRDRSTRNMQLLAALKQTATINSDSQVLCLGARNATEIHGLKTIGYHHVIGIDLVSTDPAIKIMDMHSLTFPAKSFDVVYMSHVLEHALDPQRVIAEVIRVIRPNGIAAIEVPIRYEVKGSDLIDFKSIRNVLGAFEPHVGHVYMASEKEPHTADNAMGTPIARAIFSVIP